MTALIKITGLAGIACALTLAAAAPAQSDVSCRVVEAFGNALQDQILTQVNQVAAGHSHRINKRKSLKIHSVDSVSFTGCDVLIRSNVTLKRKVRRDAHGNVNLRAKVVRFEDDEVCIAEPKVTSVNLSRTLGVGERAYKWVANRTLPGTQCFTL